MSKGYLRKSVWSDVKPIAEDMRPADVAEIKAASGSTPEKALYEGLLLSAFGAQTLTLCRSDGLPLSMFGFAPSGQADLGIAWLLASNGLKDVQTQFIRESPKYISEFSQGYRAIYNFTDARNTLHHRWLQWCGFTIIKRHESFGHEGRPFLEFCKITENRYV